MNSLSLIFVRLRNTPSHLDDLVNTYNKTLSALLDKHPPLRLISVVLTRLMCTLNARREVGCDGCAPPPLPLTGPRGTILC